MKKLLLFPAFLFWIGLASANIRVAAVFGNKMVLQRNQPVWIWGWGTAGESVQLKFKSVSIRSTVAPDGSWRIQVPKQAAGGPFTIQLVGTNNTILLEDILFGEVWLCSGQSNMEFHVNDVENAATAISEANYPMIRQIEIPKTVAGQPLKDIQGQPEWKEANSSQVGSFTAVGYFFAVELYKKLHIPIGLIHSSWGGTDVETWTSRAAFEKDREFAAMISKVPNLNLDSLAEIERKKIEKRLVDLQGGLPSEAISATFKDPAIDHGKWPKMHLPGAWEGQQLADFDGEVWFLKEIELSEAQAAMSGVLHLSVIDDNEESFINGIAVGKTNGYNKPRVYSIPAGLLKSGRNIISIRVEDTGGEGGLNGDEKEFRIQLGDQSISLAGDWYFQVSAFAKGTSSVGPNNFPTLLFNGMIAPLIPYGIKGALWYQGENNAWRAFQYRQAFPLMIKDWRKQWKEGDFPFYFVQLATFNANNGNSTSGSSWAELREAQFLTLALPNTGMAISTDIGNPTDIHPRNKQDVGKRLAAIALHDTYKQGNIAGGPVFDHIKTEGAKLFVYFKPSLSALQSSTKNEEVIGFELAGVDRIFKPAKAIIAGNRIELFSEEITEPVAVRYGWKDDDSSISLFNAAGFPASPFRSDNWPGITVNNKYRTP